MFEDYLMTWIIEDYLMDGIIVIAILLYIMLMKADTESLFLILDDAYFGLIIFSIIAIAIWPLFALVIGLMFINYIKFGKLY